MFTVDPSNTLLDNACYFPLITHKLLLLRCKLLRFQRMLKQRSFFYLFDSYTESSFSAM